MKRQSNNFRWNFIDTLIVILVVASAIGIAVRAYTIENTPSRSDSATMHFEAELLLPEVAAAAMNETQFTLFSRHTATVNEIFEDPSRIAVNENGSVRYAESALSRRVYGSLRVSGIRTDGGFFLGSDTYFVPGMTVDLIGEQVFLRVNLTKIEF